MSTNNPSVHYLGVVGVAANQDHSRCHAQWERIKGERSDEYGPKGAYNQGGCIHGQEFEGRGDNVSGLANGQQGGVDYNPGSRSICIMVGTDDYIPPECSELIRHWTHRQVDQVGKEWPLLSHSDFVATMCCGDPLRDTVAWINLFPGGLPGSTPVFNNEKGDDMIRSGKNWDGSTFAVNLSGDFITDRFTGTPDPIFGVPEDALAFAGGSIPVRFASPLQLAIWERTTKKILDDAV